MRSPLPNRLPLCVRAFAWTLLLLLGVAARAHALGIATVTLAREESQLVVTTRLVDPLEDRVERSLARGVPATVQLHVELWRRRGGWFDRLEQSADAVMRVRYDAWQEKWRLERAGAPGMELHSLDSLETSLSRPLEVTLPGFAQLPRDSRCYVIVTAIVRPLSAEDAEQAEDWLSGAPSAGSGPGLGVITALPRGIFDAVRNFAGLGDSHDRARSPEFTPSSLSPAHR